MHLKTILKRAQFLRNTEQTMSSLQKDLHWLVCDKSEIFDIWCALYSPISPRPFAEITIPTAKYTGIPGTGGKRNMIIPTAIMIPVTAGKLKLAVFSMILFSKFWCESRYLNHIIALLNNKSWFSHQESNTTVRFATRTCIIMNAIPLDSQNYCNVSQDNWIHVAMVSYTQQCHTLLTNK